MSRLAMELQDHVKRSRTEKLPDIDRMLQRIGPHGAHFPIVAFAKMDTQAAANLLYMLYLDVKSGKGDLNTYKRITIDYLVSLAKRLKSYYTMHDAYCACMQTAVELADLDDSRQVAELIRTLQLYFGQLSYWVDFAIPWSGMSEKYDELQKEKKNGLEN